MKTNEEILQLWADAEISPDFKPVLDELLAERANHLQKFPLKELGERDLHIMKPLLEKELKRISKLAQEERIHFGNGYAFGELESYMTLMLSNFQEILDMPEFKAEFEARMKRIR